MADSYLARVKAHNKTSKQPEVAAGDPMLTSMQKRRDTIRKNTERLLKQVSTMRSQVRKINEQIRNHKERQAAKRKALKAKTTKK